MHRHHQVACGDRGGSVRVYTLGRGLKALLPAHDAEVLAVDYSTPGEEGGEVLLASGGRDRLLHVYDASPQVGGSP
jgi:WD40 repeat protein